MSTLEQIRQLGEFTSLYRWSLSFTSFPDAVADTPDSEALDLRCETAEMPRKTGQTVEINLGGHKVRIPGRYEPPGTITFQFIETIDNTISDFISNWREALWTNNTGEQAATNDLKCTIEITRLDNRNSGIWKYTLTGCFLEDYDPGGTLDGSTGDPLRPSMTISYDDFTDGAV